MKTSLPKIGNDVSNDLVDGKSVISQPIPEHPRSGWAEAFAKAASKEHDMLIDDTLPYSFDDDEWVW